MWESLSGLVLLVIVTLFALQGAWNLTAFIADQVNRARGTICHHGFRQRRNSNAMCPACKAERDSAMAAIDAQRQQKFEANRKRREQEYSEWKRQARTPQFLQAMDPLAFELLVAEVYRQLGYEVSLTPATGDGGVDAFARKDGRLTIIQCKRVKGSVGEPILRDIYGALHATGAHRAIVVTTGSVSRQARAWMQGKPMEIIQSEELSKLIDSTIGRQSVVPEWFQVQERSDLCPRCYNALRVVKGRRGRFLGCTSYPQCRYSRDLQKK